MAYEICKECNGEGYYFEDDQMIECEVCYGEGKIEVLMKSEE